MTSAPVTPNTSELGSNVVQRTLTRRAVPVSKKVNNYDIIRLVAALQVAYVHGITHLKIAQPAVVVDAVKLFPGVPIFFLISGVLISMSWEGNADLRAYARNRCLRIYPALIVCLFVSVASVFVVGYLWNDRVRLHVFVAWMIGQSTFFQFLNPGFLRGYGTGALNGSLATITTELQFYVLVPLLYAASRLKARSRRTSNAMLLVLIAVFLSANAEFIRRGGQYTELTSMKIASVSFVPWFYMFLTGVLVQRNLDRVISVLRGRALVFGALYVSVAWITRDALGWRVSNEIHPVLFLLLAMFVLSFAYTAPTLAERLLHRNDISYGVYIYHMPVFNLLLYKGHEGSAAALIAGIVLSVALALTSWKIVEQPMLKRKRQRAVA